jgi:serine/threonine protein phosphatase 1
LSGFVKRWLQREAGDPVQPWLPEGNRLYCIGDIHGRLDLLGQLQQRIRADAAAFTGVLTLVYLGDYIDRGPHSRGVIDCLLEQPLTGFETVHLLGNHEQVLLDFLRHPRAVASWLIYGGLATLQSYGVRVGWEPDDRELDQLRDDLESRLPAGHLAFLQSLPLSYVAGNYCFVHAGIRPGVPLREQRAEDLLWIREDFTLSTERHEHIVVHGHTISPAVEFQPNRIGIDTGAFHTGVLSCLVLEGTEQRLIQTGSDGD